MKTFQSSSSKETQVFGELIAQKIKKDIAKAHATVIALKGELGSGKTTFVQGFLKGLGLKKRAQSPTFIIMRRHRLPRGNFKNIFHIDAYRLKEPKHLAMLGFKEILGDPRNVILVEWPERIKGLLPKKSIKISFSHGRMEHKRTIKY